MLLKCARTGLGSASKNKHSDQTFGQTRRPLNFAVEGRLGEPWKCDGTSVENYGRFFRNQVLAQMHLFEQAWADQSQNQRAPISVEVLPKKLDEEVAESMVQGF